jgi:hypothetical protein
MSSLTERYAAQIRGTLSCFDRVVLMGTIPGICFARGMEAYLRARGIRLVDYPRFAPPLRDEVHQTIRQLAQEAGIQIEVIRSPNAFRKEPCEVGERKHEIAQQHLAQNPPAKGLFLVLVARAQAPVWQVQRGENGYLNLRHPRHLPFVNHYYFHILDPEWGHIPIKVCGHPPFPAQMMLNGHEYVACQLKKAGHAFCKEGNGFPQIQQTSDLALVADALRREDARGRLSQVCTRWIYSVCLCFALSCAEREQSGFRYQLSVYQVE